MFWRRSVPPSSGKCALEVEAESLSAVFVLMGYNNIHGVTDVISTFVSTPHLARFRMPRQVGKFRVPTAVFRTRTGSQFGTTSTCATAVWQQQTVNMGRLRANSSVDSCRYSDCNGSVVECRKH